jgi:PTH1 family peptidyl-tRNA hydrolase
VRLVVGLGNPGERYAHTRHNIAWRVLDRLVERHGAHEGDRDRTFRERRTRFGGEDVVLLAPLTFMNLSGEAWRRWQDRHGSGETGWLVVSDDVYLPLGTIRLRAGGSSGGHRGLESLEAAVGHREFARLRVGVGAAESSAALREHVLDEFAPEEAPALEAAIRLAADAVECWVSQGILDAMNRFNRRVRREDTET